MNNQKETLFYNKLKEIFIGTEIEGTPNSGFINLMSIKSKYFDSVFKELDTFIKEKTKKFPQFREELYSKLYSFMKKYFSDSGYVYVRYTPINSKIYERIYDNSKDVMLYWKTNNLYYIKTGKTWKNPSLKYKKDGKEFKIEFDISELEEESINKIDDIVFSLGKVNKNKIYFNVTESIRGSKTKQVEIRRVLKKEGVIFENKDLEQIFNIFNKQNEVDFFITKNAEKFLKEKFDQWIKFFILDENSIFTEERLKELKVLRAIAYKLIEFISQFEDELVKIWNKPKFALNSNYVITLDRLANKDSKLVKKIISHPNMDEQIKEWKELEIVKEKFEKKNILLRNLESIRIKEKYKFLPLDTKYFKDLENQILNLFKNLNKSLDGWLIKSENYQALKTLLPKFKESIQTIYIDPPFNTGREFDYIDKFQDSTWLSLLENRLVLARDLLKGEGNIFVHLDDNALYLGRHLLDLIFQPGNFRAEISYFLGYNMKREINPEKYIEQTEMILHYSKTDDFLFNKIAKIKDKFLIGLKGHKQDRFSNKNLDFFKSLLKDKKYINLFDDGLFQAYSPNLIAIKEKIKENNRTKTIIKDVLLPWWEEGEYKLKSIFKKIEIDDEWTEKYFINMVGNIWMDIFSLRYSKINYNENEHFSTQKVEKLLSRVILSTSNSRDLVLDFFLGTGTTTAVAQKLNRKWIGVEMNECFYTKALPRMKKVLAGSQQGISKMLNWQGGGFFKYFEWEQYEQTLRKSVYKDSDPFDGGNESIFNQYIFRKDEKMINSIDLDFNSNKINTVFSKLYYDIDLAETLSNILGKGIKRIKKNHVEFIDGEKINFKDLNFRTIKPLIWW